MSIILPNNLSFDTAEVALKEVKKFIGNYLNDTLSVDLHEIHSCDTAGLAYLIELKRFCLLHGKILNLVNIPTMVLDLIKLYELEEILL